MSDTSSGFTVTDRRKFTLEGDLREGESSPASETSPATAHVEQAAANDSPVAKHVVDPELEPLPVGDEGFVEGEVYEDELPDVSADDSAEQHAAYRESSQQLDDMIAKANPSTKRPSAEMDFDKLVQSIYMTAALQLGAGTQPNEQPRVDILGARQSIDMLNVLSEKTKGNLTDKEQRLLQNALFELRMTFLEITNAISSSAHTPPKTGPMR